MKITDLAIIFVCLLMPTLYFLQWQDEDLRRSAQLSTQYDAALSASVIDSIHTIRLNSQADLESGYESLKFNRVDKEGALDTFFKTLNTNFGAEESIGQDIISRYVPVVGIVDYAGVHMNVYDTYTNDEGLTEWKRVWLPQIPYSYNDPAGNVISFRLDDTVRVYDVLSQEWQEGPRNEVNTLVTIPLLNNEEEFESVRRETIVSTLQENLQYYINEHNTYTRSLGVNYTFVLPTISQEDWNNSINDISIFGFIQGIPLGRGHTYNNYAFAGSRLMKNTNILGSVVDGKKVYYREDCGYNYPVEEVFYSGKQAASKGYYYLSCTKK